MLYIPREKGFIVCSYTSEERSGCMVGSCISPGKRVGWFVARYPEREEVVWLGAVYLHGEGLYGV